MTNEEKQLLLKDICARLLYDPFIKIGNNPNLFKLSTRLNWIVHYGVDGTIEEAITDNQSICKPYLRPLSSMTEEEREELSRLTNDKFKFYLYTYKPEIICYEKFNYLDGLQILDWLNSHHFDYRGLIPMGLALEAPEGMYEIQD